MENIDVHESFDDLCRRIIPLNVPGKWNVNMTQNAHIFVQNDNHEIPYWYVCWEGTSIYCPRFIYYCIRLWNKNKTKTSLVLLNRNVKTSLILLLQFSLFTAKISYRKLVYFLFIHLFIYLYIYLFIYLFIYHFSHFLVHRPTLDT